jgi:hypothetical protein
VGLADNLATKRERSPPPKKIHYLVIKNLLKGASIWKFGISRKMRLHDKLQQNSNSKTAA